MVLSDVRLTANNIDKLLFQHICAAQLGRHQGAVSIRGNVTCSTGGDVGMHDRRVWLGYVEHKVIKPVFSGGWLSLLLD